MTTGVGTMSVLGVRAMAAALVARGIDASAALVRVGIDPAQLGDPERRIELAHAFALFELACELTEDPHFGLHAAALVPGGSLDVLEYAQRRRGRIPRRVRRHHQLSPRVPSLDR